MCNKCPDEKMTNGKIVRKPVVFYKTDTKVNVVKGMSAFIIPINHYNRSNVSNGKIARTSEVLTVLPNGVFETQNTIYKPEEMQ